MKISLNEINEIDRYIDRHMSHSERALFESKQSVDPVLHEQVAIQKKIRRIVAAHGRMKLKQTLERIHQSYFSDPTHTVFRETVLSYFR